MIELYSNSQKEDVNLMKSLRKEGLLHCRISLGKFLYEKGVETCIFCHSGEEVINGEYV